MPSRTTGGGEGAVVPPRSNRGKTIPADYSDECVIYTGYAESVTCSRENMIYTPTYILYYTYYLTACPTRALKILTYVHAHPDGYLHTRLCGGHGRRDFLMGFVY